MVNTSSIAMPSSASGSLIGRKKMSGTSPLRLRLILPPGYSYESRLSPTLSMTQRCKGRSKSDQVSKPWDQIIRMIFPRLAGTSHCTAIAMSPSVQFNTLIMHSHLASLTMRRAWQFGITPPTKNPLGEGLRPISCLIETAFVFTERQVGMDASPTLNA